MTRLARRIGLILAATVISLKGSDLLVGCIDPAGVSHFANKRAFDSELLKDESVGSFAYKVAIPGEHVKAGVHYQINSLGIRGSHRSKNKPPDTYRILVLGDSVTFGWGVDCDDRFTDIVERRLRKQNTKPFVEIVNLSLPGYETTHHLQSWRRLGSEMEADVVIVVFNQNDVQLVGDELTDLHRLADQRLGGSAWMAHQLLDGPTASFLRTALPSLRDLAIFNFIFATTPSDETTLTEMFSHMTVGISTSLTLLGRMKKGIEERGGRMALFDLQHFKQIEEGCAELGIPYRSICYDGYLSDPTLRNSRADPHPNAAGHLKLADQFEKALFELKLLPEERQ